MRQCSTSFLKKQKNFCKSKTVLMGSTFWVVIGFALFIAGIEACGQTSLKTAQAQDRSYLVPLGMLFYALVGYFLYKSYYYEGMGHMNLVWNCMSTMTAFIIGFLLFGERFNHFTCIAIILAIASIAFAYLSSEKNRSSY